MRNPYVISFGRIPTQYINRALLIDNIIETLESDEYFLRAKRVEIPASITACEFYKKFGYTYKNGIDKIDEEQLFRLEKFR